MNLMDGIYTLSKLFSNEFTSSPLGTAVSLLTFLGVLKKILSTLINTAKKRESTRIKYSVGFLPYWFFGVPPLRKDQIKHRKSNRTASNLLLIVIGFCILYMSYISIELYLTPTNSAFMTFKDSQISFLLFKDKVSSTTILNPFNREWVVYFNDCNPPNKPVDRHGVYVNKSLFEEICRLTTGNDYDEKIDTEIRNFNKYKKPTIAITTSITLYMFYILLSIIFSMRYREKITHKYIMDRARESYKRITKIRENENKKKRDEKLTEEFLGIIYYNK